MAKQDARKIALPTIGHVDLNDFDLYSRARNVAVEIERPVFCLIGANGTRQINLPEHRQLRDHRSDTRSNQKLPICTGLHARCLAT